MEKKHIRALKDMHDAYRLVRNPQDMHTEIYKKYWDSPLVKTLDLTEEEFKDYLGTIRMMVDQQAACDATPIVCSQASGCHTKLIRDDEGRLEEVSVPCAKMEQIREIQSNYVYHDFPKEWFARRLDPKSFGRQVDPTQAELLQICRNMLKEGEIKHGLYVYGNVGIGKTYTMVALGNELALSGKKIAFIASQDLSYEIKNGWAPANQGDNQELIERLKNADFLFLDDMDTEADGPWFYSNLMIILGYRMNHKKITFFTSNKNMNEYEKKIAFGAKSPEAAKRLMERIRFLVNNKEFNLKGQNRRYPQK